MIRKTDPIHKHMEDEVVDVGEFTLDHLLAHCIILFIGNTLIMQQLVYYQVNWIINFKESNDPIN